MYTENKTFEKIITPSWDNSFLYVAMLAPVSGSVCGKRAVRQTGLAELRSARASAREAMEGDCIAPVTFHNCSFVLHFDSAHQAIKYTSLAISPDVSYTTAKQGPQNKLVFM